MTFQTSLLIITWVALLLLALVVSGLVRQVHALSSAGAPRPVRVGPRPGAAAPGLDRLGGTLPAVLLFLTPTCRTCAEVTAEAVELAAGSAMSVHALYRGPAPEVPTGVLAHGHQEALFDTYDAIATPFAVLVDADGRVAGSGPTGSLAALHEVLGPIRMTGRTP